MPERDQREQANQDRQSQMGGSSFEMNGQETSGRGNGSMTERNGREGKRGTSNRGFAAMSPERQKAIASEGGRAAHRQGVAHEWSSEEARQAGRKGGQAVSQNREHMSEIGRRGGQSSGSRRNGQRNEGER